ncbi:MAG: CARDB domain-containing protein [Pseudomonadota bacterium]
MKASLRMAATLLLALTGTFAMNAAQAKCTLTEIRFGLIGQGDCTLDADDLLRAVELYKARKEGKWDIKEFSPEEQWPKSRLPDLEPVAIVHLLTNGAVDTAVDVLNSGNVDAGAFDVSVAVQFVAVTSGTVTPRAAILTAFPGSQAQAPAIRQNTGWFTLPDRQLSYDLVFSVDVDPGNSMAESDKGNNEMSYVCRVLQDEAVYPNQQAGDPPICPAW